MPIEPKQTRKSWRRGTIAALALPLVLALLWVDAAPGISNTTLAQDIPNETHEVDGLQQSAEIIIDDHGVPHIYAQEHYDAFYVQGFNAARDRLWQIDLWRRRGLGEMAEVLGPEYVEQDRANRLFSYRDDIFREWLAYGNDAKRISESYTAGINAYIELTEEEPDLLPWEFEFLSYEPARWDPEDPVRLRSHAIVSNVRSEVERAYFVREHGWDYEHLRANLEPNHESTVPDGLDLSVLPDDPDDLLEVYDLATAEVSITEEDLAPVPFGEAEVAGHQVVPASEDPDTRDLDASDHGVSDESGEHRPAHGYYEMDDAFPSWDEGSNTWAVSPERTDVDGPILASDPHRAQSVPSLRYVAHLNAPGLDVIGAGEPGLPGISLGHNGNIAFGLTIFRIDQEDLYVYETNPDDPNEYLYDGRWEPMETEATDITVRASDAVTEELKFTRHGPVIYEDPEQNVAFAVRTAWQEPGMGAYFGSIEYMRANNWREFLGAMNRWGSPPENQQYVDAEGNIGWKPGGLAPVRENWDGLMPVPGDGTYEWDSFHDMDQLPESFNPDKGWNQTNNEMRLFDEYMTGPDDEYIDLGLSYEWSDPWRAIRTREQLEVIDNASMENMLELQTDNFSVPAREIVDTVGEIDTDSIAAAEAWELLREWDYHMDNDSGAAALFNVWTGYHGASGGSYLGEALLAATVDDDDVRAAIGQPHPVVMVDMVQNPEDYFGDDADDVLNDAVVESLSEAADRISDEQGEDTAEWRFGFYNQQVLTHPLSSLVDFITRREIDLGPIERGPVSNTVGNLGASWRSIIEPGNWDEALAMNNPGQSGDPDSEFYDNLFEPWAEGDVFGLHYSRDAVEANANRVIYLEPAD